MAYYFYFIWSLIFLAVWLVLFLKRKDLRTEMLLISTWFGSAGLVSEATNIQDWWQPITITRTPVGLEDFIIGFAIGGVAAVIYEEIYKKKLKKSIKRDSLLFDPGFSLLLLPSLYLLSFYIFK